MRSPLIPDTGNFGLPTFPHDQVLVSLTFSPLFVFIDLCFDVYHFLSSAYFGFNLLSLLYFLKVETEFIDLKPFLYTATQCNELVPTYFFLAFSKCCMLYFHLHSVQKTSALDRQLSWLERRPDTTAAGSIPGQGTYRSSQ